MRIRKQARISAPSIALVPDASATQVCELNRSPWDVMSFSSQSQEHEHQVNIEYNDTCNSMRREAVNTPDCFASLEKRYWEQVAKTVKKEDVEIEEEEEKIFSARVNVKGKAKKKVKLKRERDYVRCVKTDGKGWYCKNEAHHGESLCDHHLIQLKSYIGKYNYSSKKSMQAKPRGLKAQASEATTSTTRTVATNRKTNRGKAPGASPADFYYYCGFGPSWGRKRGGNEIIKKEQLDVIDDNIDQASSSSPVHVPPGHDQASSTVKLVPYDYDSEDDFDDDDEDNGGKKRIRKPIKARSLKSFF